jgi:hypothetical protein
METPIVSETQKPNSYPFYGGSWERGLDPWHSDAFAGLETDLGFNPGTTGNRKGGWFLVDGHGNYIGFVPDGTPLNCME